MSDLYDENLAFDSPDEEYEAWLDEIAQAESEMEEQYTFELAETAKMLAGGLV